MMKNKVLLGLGLALIGGSVTSAYGVSAPPTNWYHGSTGQIIGNLVMDVQSGDSKAVEGALTALANAGVDMPQFLNGDLDLLSKTIPALRLHGNEQMRIIKLLLDAGADPTYVPAYFGKGAENPIEEAEYFSKLPTNSSKTKEIYLKVIKMLKSYKK